MNITDYNCYICIIMIMRKSIYFCLSIILLLLTVCQKEPANTESVFTINTEAMYKELSILDDVLIQLNFGSGVIIDSLIFYGESGDLVLRTGAQSSSIKPLSISLQDFDNGQYTIVAFQYFQSKDSDPVWFTKDINKLSNLSIQHVDTIIDGILALGVTTETITVQNGICETTVTPKAAGSIIDFQQDGYTYFIPLPPVWLYCEKSCLGLYPGRNDESRWISFSSLPERIGCLEEGQPHHKFFTLINGEEITISLRRLYDDLTIWTYYEDSINLSPGSKWVYYYNFEPNTFYYGYLGSPEGADTFKKSQTGGDCALYPCMHWGASINEVEKYVSERTNEQGQNGILTITDKGAVLKYNIAYGLTEVYHFNNTDASDLMGVTYTFEGGDVLSKVIDSMKERSFEYIGFITQNFVYTIQFYISPDKQSEFIIYGNNCMPPVSKGYSSWTAYFYPVKQEDLDMFGIVL